MKHSSRILIAALLVLSGFSARPASGVTPVGGTDEDHANVEWATSQFDQAELALPHVVVEFHESDEGCDGYDGVFRGGEDPFRIDICTASPMIILHELAHAWDRHNLTDDRRQEFMELFGLTVWNGSGPWKERGVEALAEVITWGLRDNPVVAGADENLEAFWLTTGRAPQHTSHENRHTPGRPADDPLEAGAGWDELS